MKRVNVTFSLPESLNRQLHSVVQGKKKSLSSFVSEAIEKALLEEQEALKAAYAAANDDPDRKKVIDDWSALDNEDWNE